MRTRWAVATVAALALSLLTISTGLPSPFPEAAAAVASTPSPTGSACPANAKPANLNFTMKDMSGKNVRLAEFKGKVILLDFWATWGIPGKVEIPWFVEFEKKYGSQGLQVIGVSVDDTVEKLQPYV